MFKVKFVAHSNLKEGSFPIRIVGNLPELGNWNPLNGFEMEQYYDGQWQSIKHLEIPNGQQFQFKLVRLTQKNGIQWQQLPNNSNRKFKPKFHTKLILKWSNHIGQALNEAKSSLKFKGLPGVMINGQKEAGMLKRNPKKKNKNILSDSDSDQENQNDSFCVSRKKSTDIRQSINSGDIQQIYYDTTELQIAYQHYKQIQVNLISNCPDIHKSFLTKIQQQLKQLHELQNFKFKWLQLSCDQSHLTKLKKISLKKIESYHDDKIYLDQYNSNNNQKNHFIFTDLDAALKAVVGNASACLYLPSQQFEKATKFLNQLQKFQFICFDNGDTNKQLLKLFEDKRAQSENNEGQKLKNHQQHLFKKPQIQKSQRNFETMTIQKILQELQFCHHSETSVNTVHSFTKNQSLANILQANSILLIDSEIMKTQRKFFDSLLDSQFEKRLIIIIHKTGIPEWIGNYSESKNICVILDNFSKLYFVGKMYDPSKKHRDAIDFIQMRAKLFQKQIGGQWSIQQNSFTFYFKPGTTTKAQNIKSQIQNVLMKDYSYFKFHMKQNRLKITWNLSHAVRLLRTLVRIKSIQQGQIGNFFIVSYNQNYNQLKQQIKLLINTNPLLLIQGKATRIFYFGFGSSSNAKYSIKSQNITNQSTGSTSSSLSQTSQKYKQLQKNKNKKQQQNIQKKKKNATVKWGKQF